MKKKGIGLVGTIMVIGLMILFIPFTIQGDEDPQPSLAPLNPAFVVAQMDMNRSLRVEGSTLGHRPSPIDLSHTRGKGQELLPFRQNGYTATYDLRTYNKVTEVRNQGGCGSCWTFGTYASLESTLKPGETLDFSEQDLNINHGYDWEECEGGNANLSLGYLARWAGPISEADSPYPYSQPFQPLGFTQQKHVQQVVFLPERSGPTDNDTIKYFITQHGALYFAFYWADGYYNNTYKAFYNSATTSSNHAVSVIGWDDNYDKNKFNTPAPGNGAFLVRNSWGSSWGDSGYFWISYYDTSLQEFVSFNNAESASNFSGMYAYDPLSWVGNYGYNTPSAWAANIFTATGTHSLSAVSLVTNDIYTAFTIYIYKDVTPGSPRSGTLAATKSGTNTYPGYYTVNLDQLVPLTSGQTFSVVVSYTNSSYGYPVPTETRYSNYSSAASANPGESYLSSNGTSWVDLSNYNNSNATIKTFYTTANQNMTITAPSAESSWAKGTTQNITWTKSGSMNEYVKIRLYDTTKTSKILDISNSVANSGTFTWTIPSTLAAGNYVIRVRTVDGAVLADSPVFSVVEASSSMTITAPSAESSWAKGTTQNITWTKSGSMNEYVKIRLYDTTKTSKILDITNSIANSGTFTWTIPSTLATGNYVIRVRTVDGAVLADSPVFSVVASNPSMAITSPSTGSS